jgi:hypothetical protein
VWRVLTYTTPGGRCAPRRGSFGATNPKEAMTTTAPSTRIGRGWAGGRDAQRQILSYVPTGPDDPEPAWCVVDFWTPPDPMALPATLCDDILAATEGVRPRRTGNGSYFDCVGDDVRAIIRDIGRRANDMWWQFDVRRWNAEVKRYTVGARHSLHQDAHPGAARRKLAGTVQLSEPDSYEGGDLVIVSALGAQRLTMPRARGSLVVFPGHTPHKVEPVTKGERWSLCFGGFGPPLR